MNNDLNEIIEEGISHVERVTALGCTYLKAVTDFVEDIDLEYNLTEKELSSVIDEIKEHFFEDIVEERNSTE